MNRSNEFSRENSDRLASHRVVGSDHIVFKDGRLIIHTRADMPDWQVRSFRRPRIIFEDQDYYIVQKDNPSGSEFRYFLEPWSEHFDDLPGKTVRYDEEYVRQRDSTLRAERKAENVSIVLLIFKPFIGFLFSDTKRRIEQRYGITSKSATTFSIYLEGFAALTLFVLFTISVLVGLLGPIFAGQEISLFKNTYLAAAILILLPDLVARYSKSLKEEFSPPGFYEWMIRRRGGR